MKEKDIEELLSAGIISEDTAQSINTYYRSKRGSSPNRLLVVFGILGAILIGLGIILIIAHNWDNFSTGIKSFFAFLPLLIGQAACAYTLLRKSENTGWREASATFAFFGIGACISLISQIYHIQGELFSYLLTWMLLCAPLIYVMRSSMASLLYISGITYYAVTLGYFEFDRTAPWYFALLIAAMPHYFNLVSHRPNSNFTFFHHWLIPISLVISLATVASSAEEVLFIAYMSLFGVFYAIGNTAWITTSKIRFNSFKVLGSLGTIVILLILSFDWFWDNLRDQFLIADDYNSPEVYVALILTITATILFIRNLKSKGGLDDIKPVEQVFLIFAMTFVLGYYSSVAPVICNLLVFVIGLLTIREGAKLDNLGVLNYGLLIIAALVTCRFFDSELSFIVKGLLFLIVGSGFFLANYLLIKKRKAHDS